MSTRGLWAIQADRRGTATLREPSSVLGGRLEPDFRSGVFGCEAVEDRPNQCRTTLRGVAAVERDPTAELPDLLCGPRRAEPPGAPAASPVGDDGEDWDG